MMDNQAQQRFCTNCGQPLAPGATFCTNCGTQMSAQPAGAPAQPPAPAGPQPNYPPTYAQAQGQDDDLLLAGLAAGYVANQAARNAQAQARRRPRGPLNWLRGCGCLLLILALLVGPFVGVALTTGRLHQILIYVAVGMIGVVCLLVLIGMLATRRGREALAEGCLEAILSGIFGGG